MAFVWTRLCGALDLDLIILPSVVKVPLGLESAAVGKLSLFNETVWILLVAVSPSALTLSWFWEPIILFKFWD